MVSDRVKGRIEEVGGSPERLLAVARVEDEGETERETRELKEERSGWFGFHILKTNTRTKHRSGIIGLDPITHRRISLMQRSRVFLIPQSLFPFKEWNGKISIQSNFETSNVHINQQRLEAEMFRNSILDTMQGESGLLLARISHIGGKNYRSAVDDMRGGMCAVESIEDVLNAQEDKLELSEEFCRSYGADIQGYIHLIDKMDNCLVLRVCQTTESSSFPMKALTFLGSSIVVAIKSLLD
ncbi:hypothetical protein PIB30_073922 [Stylosanthes scabra]|uniref:Uncharacterized protein n=1 Tax=Stylosanthes scabra TaxID=79078 RepID=A0ABU6XQ87_9FABA|nr:hypothetical protein [Stylosanthes scabra]